MTEGDSNRQLSSSNHDERQLELGFKFIENQARQIELDEKRMEHEARYADKGFEFSQKALEVEAADRIDVRKRRNQLVYFSVVCGLILILVLALSNKDATLLDLGKICAGIIGGYGWRAIQVPKKSDSSSEE